MARRINKSVLETVLYTDQEEALASIVSFQGKDGLYNPSPGLSCPQ